MNPKDRVFLGKCFVKESIILIGLENSGTREFSIKGGLGGPPLINKKMRKSLPKRVPSTKYLHPSHKSLTPPVMLLEIEHY